jgi:L-amino acid N-acyltransferase YncA
MPLDLRSATPDDASAIAAIYAHYVRETVISFEAEPPDAGEMGRRIAATLPRFPWLVATDGNEVTGYAYAGAHMTRAAYRWSVDVSVYVHSGRHRRGIGKGLYLPLFEVLRGQGFVNAYAGVTLPNPASVGLHESLGFEPVGVYRRIGYKFGRWHDVGWWSLALAPHPEAPAEPVPFAEFRRTPALDRALAAGR